MALLAIHDWSQFTVPPGIPPGDLTGDTHANDPAAPDYDSGVPTWIGETFTFNGGAPTQIDIVDDDAQFEDAYVETGGAQVLAQDVTINGTLYSAGSVVENEFSLIDSGGVTVYVVRINNENVGFAYSTGNAPNPGDDFTATRSRDGDPADNAPGEPSSTVSYSGVICFAAGTQIAVPGGWRRVESVRQGDLVLTRDHGACPVVWRGTTALVAQAGLPARQVPVRLGRHSLGHDRPARPLIVSQQHKVLVQGSGVAALFGAAEVLAPAKGLLGLPRLRLMRGKRRIVYHHLMLAQHGLLNADGLWAESYFPGPCAMAGLSRAQRGEVARACGGLCGGAARYGQPTLPCLTVGQARHLVHHLRGMAPASPPGPALSVLLP